MGRVASGIVTKQAALAPPLTEWLRRIIFSEIITLGVFDEDR